MLALPELRVFFARERIEEFVLAAVAFFFFSSSFVPSFLSSYPRSAARPNFTTPEREAKFALAIDVCTSTTFSRCCVCC